MFRPTAVTRPGPSTWTTDGKGWLVGNVGGQCLVVDEEVVFVLAADGPAGRYVREPHHARRVDRRELAR